MLCFLLGKQGLMGSDLLQKKQNREAHRALTKDRKQHQSNGYKRKKRLEDNNSPKANKAKIHTESKGSLQGTVRRQTTWWGNLTRGKRGSPSQVEDHGSHTGKQKVKPSIV